MKVNKKDPKHWLYIIKSNTYILLSILLRPFLKKNKKPAVTFFGHKLNGNLLAFYDYLNKEKDYVLNFASLDQKYCDELKEAGSVNVINLGSLKDVIRMARTDVVIADRMATLLMLYQLFTDMRFVDVWHGIQLFKKFSSDDMAPLKRYEEIWVPSKAIAEVYKKEYGLEENKIKITGYARVDKLVKGEYSEDEIKKKYGISKKYKKIILLAPTWQQDDAKRQIIPFQEEPDAFLSRLNETAQKNNALIIFRAHLNTNAKNRLNLKSMKNIKLMSHNDYPQSEEFLYIADLLISDWSSISLDYLPLHRPMIFLDVPIPFRHGLTFDGEHRFGEIVTSLTGLAGAIDEFIEEKGSFYKKYKNKIKEAEDIAYGDTLDGKSTERYGRRLERILGR